jgi:uncharacterized protein (DUF779 family)
MCRVNATYVDVFGLFENDENPALFFSSRRQCRAVSPMAIHWPNTQSTVCERDCRKGKMASVGMLATKYIARDKEYASYFDSHNRVSMAKVGE